MFKYKRELNNYDEAKKVEYSLSDNSKVCFCTTGSLYTRKPYHGMYIRNGKVLLENIAETFEINGTVHRVVEVDTKNIELNSKNYLTEIDLEKNIFEYSIGELSYSKRFAFEEKTGTLCVEYIIKNNYRSNIKFNVIPLVTYRDFHNMKNNSMLKFNQRDTKNGTIISLSVLNQENLVLKSDKMKWNSDKTKYLNDVKHEQITSKHTKEIYYEDLAICGEFEYEAKGLSETKIYVFFSHKDFNIEKINLIDVYKNIETRNKNATFNVDENFVELLDLAKSMVNADMQENMIATLPYEKEYNEEFIKRIGALSPLELENDIDTLINIIRAIEGKYLCFNKIKEAKVTAINIYKIIKEIGKLELEGSVLEKYNNLKLWYIESVNRILQKEGRIELYIDSIKEILNSLTMQKDTAFTKIETTALMLNAIKIYLNILTWIGDTDENMELQEKYFSKLIENEFWIPEKNIMKRDLNEQEHTACIEMLYVLSLSFPCVSNGIPNKILDTVFKELYTPYGLRKISKFSPLYDNMIYPEYMAHFIKANLRLTGVTRASQKIAYNLVKELLQDVGKYVNGGVRKVYQEKGKLIDDMSYDILTNAEVIRLYHMFI